LNSANGGQQQLADGQTPDRVHSLGAVVIDIHPADFEAKRIRLLIVFENNRAEQAVPDKWSLIIIRRQAVPDQVVPGHEFRPVHAQIHGPDSGHEQREQEQCDGVVGNRFHGDFFVGRTEVASHRPIPGWDEAMKPVGRSAALELERGREEEADRFSVEIREP
jgi:hypothetical protein